MNLFRSGSAIVPSVPVISTSPCRGSGESKLNSSDAAPPQAYSTSAPTWVGTSTGELNAGLGPGADDPGGGGLAADRRDPGRRAEDRGQGREVVRPEVEQRARPDRNKNSGLGCQLSGPGLCIRVSAVCGTGRSRLSAMSRRAV